MTRQRGTQCKSMAAALALLACGAAGSASQPATNQVEARRLAREQPVPPPPGKKIVRDDSGRNQVGEASVYGAQFQGHRMADGKPFNHAANVAASRSLPLGTVAKVTNLKTGQSATVTVEDHGPFANGRVVDLSKATASQIGISHRDGVAPVEVSPEAVPQPDGSIKAGAGAVSP